MDAIFAYIIVIFLTLFSFMFLPKLNRRKPQNQTTAKLPPGSMGWPYIGETLQLYSQDPNVYFSTKHKRFGEIFKTNILGCPCVMLISPEAARFVLVTQAHLFKPTYPKSKERLIGPFALFFHQGDYHTRLRKLVQRSLSFEALRNLVPHIEALVLSGMNSWGDGQVINMFKEMKRISFEVGILTTFGHLEPRSREELKKNYRIVDAGYNSFPTCIPGTQYQKALLDTTASAMTWVVKYLHDEPKLLESVKAEQKAIHKSNEGNNLPLSWDQTRNMRITHKVVLESLRMASIISFPFREAIADVEYKGFLIPKGWKAMPLFRNIHHNPEFFPEPQKFNPSRFEVAPKPNTFMPFGSGVHACPGNELAKLETLIMIHHLVTKFRWEVVGSKCGIQYGPFPLPLNGLPARCWRESTS
ncbi:abscisic acid 8'-hydroxylase 2-like isoform X2 [Vigna unguiculata]|uniref:abscisic acid 8'-hydroxylase 2-like isoform X2 n=1 Tax=Vigna unguiculata TaxID=3917 RepID=UPI001016B57B|nr:abscisic acid 8'-hydroxylase 2-like isoform X2 [Vigna unguiculata]